MHGQNLIPARKPKIPHPDNMAPAAEAFYAQYAERVYRFALRLCNGNCADAEDLAQDVLLSALRTYGSFQGRSAMLTYLYRIAINRSQRVRTQSEAAERREQYAATTNHLDPSDAAVERIELQRAIAELPDDLRISFLVVKAEGLTYREAAKILEIPQGTIQFRVHEATRRLRAALSDTFASEHAPNSRLSESFKENCHAV